AMARRYSTAEKAKWTSTTFAPVRRAPIPIPATNNSALIEQNKLSLIRRVTNSAAQNTRALEVELEYEKLEKHCFSCASLSHEQDKCMSRFSKTQGPMGINQSRTLEKLAERRRTDDRVVRNEERSDRTCRNSHRSNDVRHEGHSKATYDRSLRTDYRLASSEYRRPPPSSPPRRNTYPRKETWVPRKGQSSGSIAGSEPRGSGRLAPIFPPPRSRPVREPLITPPGPTSAHANSRERRSALERISPVVSLIGTSEKRPARDRLSLPTNREHLPRNEEVTTDSGILQDVELQYFEETMGDLPFIDRTGAEDRLHVSLRLGHVPAKPDTTITLSLGRLPKRSGRIAAKTLGKRKAPDQPTKKKIPRSPVQGVSLKKRRVTKGQQSSKRRLVMSASGAKTGPAT
ncbi:hypothetical protein HID58_068320, partial [Brassica napus]